MTTTRYDSDEEGSGWLIFAGTILGLAGIMRIIDAFWAFSFSGSLPDNQNLQEAVLGDNIENYGWVWLFVGIIMLASSFFVIVRLQLARWIGFIAAAIGGLSAMTWMPYYPVWSLVYIALAVLVFYALARYGGRLDAGRQTS